jgi:hypothetical protein
MWGNDGAAGMVETGAVIVAPGTAQQAGEGSCQQETKGGSWAGAVAANPAPASQAEEGDDESIDIDGDLERDRGPSPGANDSDFDIKEEGVESDPEFEDPGANGRWVRITGGGVG